MTPDSPPLPTARPIDVTTDVTPMEGGARSHDEPATAGPG